ncbi:MAG: VOC family protein [Candidatus Sericytochromatia bacterium]
MQQRLSLITLGVQDLARSRAFYEQGLGWTPSKHSQESVAFYQLGGYGLALWDREALAEDAGLAPDGAGFGGITLAYNVARREEVETVVAEALAAGATLLKEPGEVFWGGYTAYFADPDGYPWEVAWNPGFEMDEAGRLIGL